MMRIGIVGLRTCYWPHAFAGALQGKRGIKVCAAATLGDRDGAIEKILHMSPTAYASRFGLTLYRSAEEMIEAEDLDTIILTVPHSRHLYWAERLAPLGVNMFIPKTFATTANAACRITALEKKHKIRIASGPSGRFLPPVAAAKKAIDKGLIGKPFAFRIMHHHGALDSFHSSDWYRDAREGGPELSLGWYVIDLVLHFMGPEVTRVSADYANFTTPGSPFMDCGQMTLVMRNGALACCNMFFCNRMTYPSWELEITGPKGAIKVQQCGPDVPVTEAVLLTSRGRKILPLPARSPHWEAFWAEELRDRRPLSVTAADAAWITELSLAARHSSRAGRPVRL